MKMDLERLTVEELLAKKPDYSWIPVYKPTGVYYLSCHLHNDSDNQYHNRNNQTTPTNQAYKEH